MSKSATTGKFQFFIYAPDRTEPGTFEKRMSVRPQHLELLKANIASGAIRVGAALLTPESLHASQEDRKLVGSTLIWEAESIEEVRKNVEADPYYIHNVWDREKIVIHPIAAATAIP